MHQSRSKLLGTQPPEDVGAILELHQGKGFVFGELFEMLSLDGKPLHQPQREVTRTCASSHCDRVASHACVSRVARVGAGNG